VFYQFNASPLNFNPKVNDAIANSKFSSQYQQLESRHAKIEDEKRMMFIDGVQNREKEKIKILNAQDLAIKEEAKDLVNILNQQKDFKKIESNDKDYVFIHFILNNLPRGLIGLLLAVILSAAMSSTASELNALASTTAIDLYKRNLGEEKTEEHYVKASKWFTLAWGIIAISVACIANLFDNLIQLVNIIGSIFYGNVLGIFLLAFFIKFVRGNAVFIAALITQLIIIYVFLMDWLPYLWLNLLGCVLVMGIAIFIQTFTQDKSKLKLNEG